MKNCNHIKLDAQSKGEQLNFRRHSFGQGGFDDMPFTPEVIERIKPLHPELIRIFVQEYFAMMPAVGEYHWTTIDTAVAAIVACGATPLLALCMKPPCIFPRADFKLLVPSDWDAWENFIEEMVRHFSEDMGWSGIWYEVANEPDIGGGAPYVFGKDGAVEYAQYYEKTVGAVLRGDSTAKVGGPTLAFPRPFEHEIMTELVRHIQAHNLPIDFVSWHNYEMDPAIVQKNVEDTIVELKKAGEPFASAITVLDEWNSTYVCDVQIGEFRQSAYLVDVICRCLLSGLDYSCYYHIMDIDLHPSKWETWYPAEALKRVYETWGQSYRGLHFIKQDGTPSLTYIALRMLSRMEGRAVGGGYSKGLQYIATTLNNICRVLCWNYYPEGCSKTKFIFDLEGLSDVEVKETHYSLSGYNIGQPSAKEVAAARKGEMYVLNENIYPKGKGITKTVECMPFCVHLVEFSW